MHPRFAEERKYLANVPPRTIDWYRAALKWLDNPAPDSQMLKDFVMRMRQVGLKASSCNCHIRAVNNRREQKCLSKSAKASSSPKRFCAWRVVPQNSRKR
jgi:hypothetical protein